MTHRTVWEAFYGLYARPFSLTPDLRFAFQSASHSHAIDEVSDALQRREGVIVVTGEVGTGKTMLCRAILAKLEKRSFKSVILDPLLSAEELMLHVLMDFGLITREDPAHREPMSDVTRHRLVTTLHQFLASLIPLNAHAVLLIDEAQHLSPGVLEQVRLLANFETDQAKLLQIVLVGQPNLDELLNQAEMRPLNQRIARRVQLQPLKTEEVRDYVEKRIAVASERPKGAEDEERDAPVSFSDDAIVAIAAITERVPRVINTLCDRALQAAFDRQAQVVDRKAVVAGAEHLKLPIPPGQRMSKRALVVAALIVIGALAVGWWWSTRTRAAAPASTTPAGSPEGRATTPPGAATPTATTAPAAESSPSTAPFVATPPPAATATSAPAATSAPVPPAAATTPAAAGSASGAEASSPATATAPAGTPPTATPGAPAAGTPGSAFEIEVAAFRTAPRADEVADDIADTGLPVGTRFENNWHRVIVGPFPTRAEAEAARGSLVQQGFSGTRITPTTVAP